MLAAVFGGGALGAAARYGVSVAIAVPPATFPWATFATNISGSFAAGLVLTVLVARYPSAHRVRALVATGFIGAFTTYSTFAVETQQLLADGSVPLALLYVAASVGTGFAAVWSGILLGRRARGGGGDPGRRV